MPACKNLFLAVILILSASLLQAEEIQVPDGQGQKTGRGYEINVLQDCWTTNRLDWGQNPELESYLIHPDSVVFVWKHKLIRACDNYVATIVLLPCEDGKPRIGGRIVHTEADLVYGPRNPEAEIIMFHIPSDSIPVGTYDWFIVTECNDTNNRIGVRPDGDVDDVIGANLGLPPVNPYGPLVYGPEPNEVLDPNLGAAIPGRRPGEEGSSRCWCFTVER